jgi:hypothetical protein
MLKTKLKIENSGCSGHDFKGADFEVYIPGNSTGANAVVAYIPYRVAAANIAALQALGSTITVTNLGVIDDGVHDSTQITKLIVGGAPAVTGNEKLLTSGSSTTVATTNNAFALVLPGATIVANGTTRHVVSKTNSNTIVVDSAVDWNNSGAGYAFTYKNPLLIVNDDGTVRGWIRSDGVMALGSIVLSQQAHIADAVVEHAITDPVDAPTDADALREDLVTNVIPSIETALNALGGKVNTILANFEALGLNAAS